MRHLQRGSALIIATIVILIIGVIGLGMVRYTQRETAGAMAGQRADALSACAEAARRMLEARFHSLGTPPASVNVLNVVMDGPSGRQRAAGGHIDTDMTQPLVSIKQVEAMPANIVLDDRPTQDLSNTIIKTRIGGTPLKVQVHCQEGDLTGVTTGRQMEIEYAVRFGL